jgi:hypothetical protein
MKLAAALTFAVAAVALATPARAVDVLTYHNDNLRSGWNAAETSLTPATVGSSAFKRVFDAKLDFISLTQPLVATAEKTSRGMHDLMIVGTEKGSLYAFDAHDGRPVWHVSLIPSGAQPVGQSFTGCPNQPLIGELSTPVIDRALDTVYAVSGDLEGASGYQHIHYRLHAIALGTGADRMAPVEMAASVKGADGTIVFNADVQSQRSALVEANGNIYVVFGSTCDYNGNLYHGWIFTYKNASLAPVGVFNTTGAPDSGGNYQGGIWMSGNGMAVAPNGDLMLVSGNGMFNKRTAWGNSALRLTPNGTRVLDYFTPDTLKTDNQGDADFGSGGLMLLPDLANRPSIAFGQGKDGILTMMDRDNLGGYTPGGPDHALYELNLGSTWSSPAYFATAHDEYVLTTGGPLYLVHVQRSPAKLNTVQQTNEQFENDNGNGSTPSVSSNGQSLASAVTWIVQWSGNGTIALRAYAVNNLAVPLVTVPLGPWHFTQVNSTMVPTIANGYVYVVTLGHLYGFTAQ